MSEPCDRLRSQLDAYVSGELAGAISEEIGHHLETCADCSAEVAGLRRLRGQLKAAVQGAPVPSGLETRVRNAVRRQPARTRTGLWAVAAAAVVVLSVFLISQLRTHRDPEATILAKTTGRLAALLNVGLRDHLECAVFRKYPKTAAPPADLAATLGAGSAELAPQIQAKLPAGFHIVETHHCAAGGRQFTHVIVSDGAKIVSVLVTPAWPGEWLNDGIQQQGVDRFQVVSFESNRQLVYVISDLDAHQNLVLAANLAPTLRQFLAAHAG